MYKTQGLFLYYSLFAIVLFSVGAAVSLRLPPCACNDDNGNGHKAFGKYSKA